MARSSQGKNRPEQKRSAGLGRLDDAGSVIAGQPQPVARPCVTDLVSDRLHDAGRLISKIDKHGMASLRFHVLQFSAAIPCE